jgi:type IV secretion system protein TrbL
LRALAVGSAHAGRLAAGAAAAGADVLSGAGVGHAAPYYGQPPGRAAAGGNGRAAGRPASARHGRPAAGSPDPLGASAADRGEGTVGVLWPAEQADGAGPGGLSDADDPTLPASRDDSGADGGAG